MNIDDISKIFPTAPGLDNDLGRIGMTLDGIDREISGSLEFGEYYANLHRHQVEGGEITPISYGSEAEFNTTDATAGSSSAPDFDFTITEEIVDIEMIDDNNETLTSAASKSFIDNCNAFRSSAFAYIPPNIHVCNNDLGKTKSNIKRAQSLYTRKSEVDTVDIRNLLKDFDKGASTSHPNVNISNVGCLKWSTSKEKFFDVNKETKTDNIDFGKNLNTGASKKVNKDSILIKEGFIDPPKISKSFHGNSSSYLDIEASPRRASDIPLVNKMQATRPQFVTQLSQPCSQSSKMLGNMPTRNNSFSTESVSKSPRFTTIKVDEEEHAASVGLVYAKRAMKNDQSNCEMENLGKRKNLDDE